MGFLSETKMEEEEWDWEDLRRVIEWTKTWALKLLCLEVLVFRFVNDGTSQLRVHFFSQQSLTN